MSENETVTEDKLGFCFVEQILETGNYSFKILCQFRTVCISKVYVRYLPWFDLAFCYILCNEVIGLLKLV